MPHAALAPLFLLLAALLTAGSGTAAPAECPRALRTSQSPASSGPAPAVPAPLTLVAEDLLKELLQRSGLRVDRIEMPRVRAFADYKAGKIDFVTLAARTEDRDQHGQLLPLGRLKPMLIVLKSHAAGLRNTDDLLHSGLRLMMVRGQQFGAGFQSLLDRAAQTGRFSTAADQLTLVRMLKAGRAEAILGLPALFEPVLRAEAFGDQITVLDLNLSEPVDEGVYVSDKVPAACLQRLSQTVRELRDSGWYRALVARHVPPEVRQGLLP